MLLLGVLAVSIVMHITAVAGVVVVAVVAIFRRLHKIFTPPTIIIALHSGGNYFHFLNILCHKESYVYIGCGI